MSEQLPEFTGIAISAFPGRRHLLNMCVIENEPGSTESMTKNPDRSWKVTHVDEMHDGFERILTTAADVVSDQKRSNALTGRDYKTQIIVGWPGDEKVQGVDAFKRAAAEQSPPCTLKFLLRAAIHNACTAVDPQYPFGAVDGSAFYSHVEQLDNLDPTDLIALHDAAVAGDSIALAELIRRAVLITQFSIQDYREKGGADTIVYLNIAVDLCRYIDLPEVVTAMEATLRSMQNIPPETTVRVAFPHSTSNDQFFDITRSKMHLEINRVLGV